MSAPDLAWSPGDLEPVLILATATVTYAIYHYGASAGRLATLLRVPDDDDEGRARCVHLQRLTGAVLLGGVPALVAALALPAGLADLGVAPGRAGTAIALALGTWVAVLPFLAFNARNPANHDTYPQIRTPRWSRGLVARNAASWLVYLVAYEFLFRGFLVLGLAPSLGTWPAIAVTTAFYVAVHLVTPWGEGLSTMVAGVGFAVLVIHTGTLLGPVLLHVGIAVTNDLLAVRANPRMELG